MIVSLRKLRDTAKAIGLEDGVSTFAAAFQLPKSRSYDALLTHVRNALEAARPHLQRFAEFELPEGFLERMAVVVGLIERADDSQEAGRSSQIGSTAGLTALVDRGMELREKLSPLVRNRFESEPGVWAEWQSASRVVRRSRPAREARPASALPPVV